MPVRDALAALDMLLDQQAACSAVVPIAWDRIARSEPFFAGLQRPGEPAPVAARPGDPLSDALAEVLGVQPAALDPDLPLRDYGFDSLMAISLRNRLRANAGIDLPLATILQGASLRDLANAAADRRLPTPSPAGLPDVDRAAAETMLTELLAEQTTEGDAP